MKFDQLYCINELLANYILLVSIILLGYEKALWLKKLDISHASQIQKMIVRFWFFLSCNQRTLLQNVKMGWSFLEMLHCTVCSALLGTLLKVLSSLANSCLLFALPNATTEKITVIFVI